MWPVVFVDVKTGGLHPARAPLLEVAWLPWWAPDHAPDFADVNVVVVEPAAGMALDPEAVRVNGYEPAFWRARGALREYLAFHRWAGGIAEIATRLVQDDRHHATFAGHNTPFDRRFLYALEARHGESGMLDQVFGLRDLDTARLAILPWLAGALTSTSLDACRRELLNETPPGYPHTAASDVWSSYRVARYLLDRVRGVPWR